MYTIQSYKKVDSLEEAYALNQKKSTTIIGGGMWLRLGSRPIGTAIDLSGLGLNQIEETEDSFNIGCMTTLREIESHQGLNRYFHEMPAEMMRSIVGIQFRNTATIGGSIYQRFGFSDPLTGFLALNTEVEMYGAGRISLEDFVNMKYDRDILVALHVKKDGCRAAYESFRNTKTDFPVVTVAVSRKEDHWKAVIGARPGRARVAEKDYIMDERPSEEAIKKFAVQSRDNVHFGSNMRAGAEYRSLLAEVLIKRAVKTIVNQPERQNG